MNGQRVGNYDIVRLLARGGMSVVYLARQTTLDREVALKRLDLDSDDPTTAERFVREARIAAGLAHPNIVMLLDFFEDGGTPYIAMEYVAGGSLRPFVRWLTLPQVFGVLEGTLAGLAHAEPLAIAHRDLKPENLLLTRAGTVKIADFGIARAYDALTDRLTRTSLSIGTPTYMAPEQALDERIGPWTDLYALGVIAYEMLAGRPPFERGDVPLTVLYHHVHTPPPPLRSLAPEVPEPLAAWVEQLLAKAPADRPASAAEAWRTAEEIAVGELGPYWRRAAAVLPAPAEGDRAEELTVHGDGPARAPRASRGEATALRTPPDLERTTPADDGGLRATVALPGGRSAHRSRRIRRTAVAVVAAALVAGVAALVVLVAPGDRDAPARAARPFDFDADGFQDAAIAFVGGAPRGAGADRGVVVVQHGVGDAARPEVITPADAGVPEPAGPDDEFGNAITSGDFDRDGHADIAIGTPGRGFVSVLYGTDGGRLADGRRQELDAAVLDLPRAAGRYGSNLVASDVDRDGFDDLLVSAPGDGGTVRTGIVQVLPGSASGLRTDAATLLEPPGDAPGFGRRLRAGDFDGDGNVDLVEGAPDELGAGGVPGHASVCPGSPSGPLRCEPLAADAGGTSSLAVADVDGDGYADIVQGDSGDRGAPRGGPGEVRVWRGGPRGPAARPIRITRASAGVAPADVPGERFGAVVDARDLDGDGFADIVAGATASGGTGSVSVIRGARDGYARIGNRSFDPATPGIPGRPRANEAFGVALAIADLTHDRRPDILVGVPGERSADEMVVLVPGRPGGPDPRRSPAFRLRGLGRLVRAAPSSGIRLARPGQR